MAKHRGKLAGFTKAQFKHWLENEAVPAKCGDEHQCVLAQFLRLVGKHKEVEVEQYEYTLYDENNGPEGYVHHPMPMWGARVVEAFDNLAVSSEMMAPAQYAPAVLKVL